ncbi:MAG: arginine repressor [Desulfitobacteriaceae bacterium]|nr:arginine repressor [Desulfitobacteriaceae bacterium]MDI6880106.1 arginine repressor [Desulfitobacteriaceae bacterium]MDI6912963.1 arginine repressor [Desulfitobacteriaceae bacterium]
MKTRRQIKIQELIGKEVIRTQEELAERLREEGFDVTQATVSRDIKELGLIKVPSHGEEYRYALSTESHPANFLERLKRLFRETVVSVNDSENLVLIRTIPGHAHALASLIDGSDWDDMIGTVAGDDTILLVVKPKEATVEVLARINSLMG